MLSIPNEIPTFEADPDILENLSSFLHWHEHVLKEFGGLKIQLNGNCQLALKKRLIRPLSQQVQRVHRNAKDCGMYSIQSEVGLRQPYSDDLHIENEINFWAHLSNGNEKRTLQSNISIIQNKSLFYQKWNKKYFSIHRVLKQSLLKLAGTRFIDKMHSNLLYTDGNCAIFPLETHPNKLSSIIFHHQGGPRYWYIIPSSQEHLLQKYFLSNKCVYHQQYLIDPSLLDRYNIRYHRIVQRSNEIVVLASGSYHESFSLGGLLNESIDFALPHWINDDHILNQYDSCQCLAEQTKFYQRIPLYLFDKNDVKTYIEKYSKEFSQEGEEKSSMEKEQSSECSEESLSLLSNQSFQVQNVEEEEDFYSTNTFSNTPINNYENLLTNECVQPSPLLSGTMWNSCEEFASIDDVFNVIFDDSSAETEQQKLFTNTDEKHDRKISKTDLPLQKHSDCYRKLLLFNIFSNITKSQLYKQFPAAVKIVIKPCQTSPSTNYATIRYKRAKDAKRDFISPPNLASLGSKCSLAYENESACSVSVDQTYNDRKIVVQDIPQYVTETNLQNLFPLCTISRYCPAKTTFWPDNSIKKRFMGQRNLLFIEKDKNMDRIAFEKDLIAILLVVESAHDKNKLLYKYEQANRNIREPEPVNFHTSYSIVIAKDFDPPSAKDDDAPRTTFRNFDETTIAILTSPNSYGTHVEVQVDDVIFVGHTLGLEQSTDLKSFAVFFVLRAIAKASVIISYQEMSQRIGTAIRCEEQRVHYLKNEYDKLLTFIQPHEIAASDSSNRRQNEDDKAREIREQAYSMMAEESQLAATLKQIFTDLQVSGEINITINNWLNVSCCLPHRSIALNCSLEPDFAFNVLSNAEQILKPYYGILLVIDPSALLASLPIDSSSTLSTLVRHLRSSYSMSRLSIETGLPLTQIYRLASHLLYWGRAKLIYPIYDDNVYIISPDADISKNGSLSKLYKETFRNTTNYPTLQETLAEYSDAVPFYDHMTRSDSDSELQERFQCVEWLLRHRLLVQVHYYYYLLLPNDNRSDFKEEYKQTRLPRPRVPLVRLLSEVPTLPSSPSTNQFSYSSAHHSRSTDTLKTMTGTSQDDVFAASSINSNTTTDTGRYASHYLAKVSQALPNERLEYQKNLAIAMKDAKEQHVTDFLRLIKYLNGTYHLEEIAAMENMTRLQVLTIIEKFQSIVIRALHPDPNPILQI
ncbi:unnamed protein product [Adineta ricciae]|uniref:GATOR complex protein NPRL3 n=1 Tax=Adineta ricciae TaxID=249248 RepID=A0A815BCK2_ADIRI|nr:unnamed protein product [Adineta ricciae]